MRYIVYAIALTIIIAAVRSDGAQGLARSVMRGFGWSIGHEVARSVMHGAAKWSR